MKVGKIDIIPVLDGVADLPIEAAATHARGSAWDCGHQPLDERGRIRMGVGSFLVRIGSRTVLVDLGAGPGPLHEAFRTGGLLANLGRTGVAPGDVTDVVFTHLHIDHVGWSTVRGEVTFPRATHWVHAADWAHFMTGAPADPDLDPLVRGILAPIEGQLATFDEETELLPGLLARPAPGHTPGSTVFVVSDAGERALLLGDVTHTVAELTDPEWEGAFDVDRTAANAVRNRIAAELAASGDVFAPAHFPGLAFGRLVTADGLRRFAWA
ncbi:MBL fold metallo-hydrolase [Amycolatopsis ultiminotia]|uniref:MBL fold metallo-hydrolase n=1 Tax=Amycolatopsis ultiminotia TaxID=543629 RepID=A0ABP6XHT3_9PSEU